MKNILLLLIGISVIFACTETKNKSDYLENINKLENNMYTDTVSFEIDTKIAKNLINAYDSFATDFPKDSLAPDYLFKSAEISRALSNPDKSIENYNKVINDYKDYKRMPYCIFLKAFVYENQLNDIIKAKKYYTKFVDNYPDHDFADDAKVLIENLGKSPEELIKSFEEKNKNKKDSLEQN